MSTNDRRALNPGEAAAYLGLTGEQLTRLRRHRHGPAYRRVDGVIVYEVADLDAYLDAAPRYLDNAEGGAS